MDIIDAAIHVHYVSEEGIIKGVKILQNWADPKEAIRMMLMVYCRYYGISEDGFNRLNALADKIVSADLRRSRIGLAAAVAFYGLFDGKDGRTQELVSQAFGVTKSTIRNNHPFYVDLATR